MNTRKLLATIALALAFLPVLNWYWLRLGNGNGEPFGLLALTLAVGLAFQNRHTPNLRLAEITIVFYALGLFFLPPLLRTIPALATIAFLTGMHRQAGQFGLLLLSLPIQASLDFFLGYPFRFITAEGSRILVNLLGYPVERLGVQLSLKGVIVSVDPPCSGLQMLWATALLTALLSAILRLNYRRTLYLSLIAFTLCLLANSLRAAALFFPESGMLTLPDFAHEGIGLAFFALASILLSLIAQRFQSRPNSEFSPNQKISTRFLTFAFGASLISLLPARSQSPLPLQKPETLTHYQGRHIVESALSPREKSFAKNFPGHLQIYSIDGHETLIIRRVTRATRMLHPSSHCLKAEGFTISQSRVASDEEGRPYLRYHATRKNETYLVTERISDLENHRQWTEVSAWYWSALFNPHSGPWQAETLLTPLTKHHD